MQKKTPANILPVLSATLLLACGNGCLSYPRPALPADAANYTSLTPEAKNTLPAELETLTVQDAVQVALANNYDFLSIRFALDSARARYYQSFSGYAPTLNAGMSLSQSFGRTYSGGKGRSQSESYQPSLSGRWLIFDSLAREMNVLSSREQLRSSEANLEDARRLLTRAVIYAYNDVIQALSRKEIVQAQLDYSQRMLKDARNKYQVGNALKSDVQNFEISLRNAELDMIQTEHTIASTKYVLAGYLGLTDGNIPESVKFPRAKMPEAENLLEISAYLDQALANRPDLRSLRSSLEAAKYQYYATLGSFGPSISATYNLGYGHSRSIRHGNGGGHSRSDSGNFNYGISASWNLFNGFSDYNSLRIARDNVAETDYLLSEKFLNIITEVRTAYDNYLASVRQTQLSREICDLTLETRNQVENEYQAGTALVTRLNEAERDLVQAQNNLVTSIVNVSNAKAQLEAAVYAVKTPDITIEETLQP